MNPTKRGETLEMTYRFRLFVTDDTPEAQQTVSDVKSVLALIHGSHDVSLEVHYALQEFDAVIDAGIIATPSLILDGQQPARSAIGSFTNSTLVLDRLGVPQDHRKTS